MATNAFRGSRLPLTESPGAGNSTVSRATHRTTPPTRPIASENSQKTYELFQKTLDEQRKVREDVMKIGQLMNACWEELKQLKDEFKQHNEESFTIESSGYKDGLLREMSVLFTKSLKRQPSREEIGHSIARVLHQEVKSKFKFNKAKVFCNNRLTDLRCEERRRIFGNKPCEAYPLMSTAKFADKFLSSIKAPDSCRTVYIKHLALLRLFARECEESKSDTYKKFREWLDKKYLGGPNEEELSRIIQQDEEYNYSNNGNDEFNHSVEQESFGVYFGEGEVVVQTEVDHL